MRCRAFPITGQTHAANVAFPSVGRCLPQVSGRAARRWKAAFGAVLSTGKRRPPTLLALPFVDATLSCGNGGQQPVVPMACDGLSATIAFCRHGNPTGRMSSRRLLLICLAVRLTA